MSFPSLTERPLLALGGLRGSPRGQDRHRPSQGQAGSSPPQPPAETGEPAPPRADEGLHRPIVSVDLAALSEYVEREPSTSVAAPTAAEFLAAFAALLGSVSSGDIATAREAANSLQLELFGMRGDDSEAAEGEEDAALRMLEDLVALIGFARRGDLGAAESAAALLARHMQTALLAPAPPPPAERLARRRRAARLASPHEPPPLVQGATAAYELVMDAEPGLGAA